MSDMVARPKANLTPNPSPARRGESDTRPVKRFIEEEPEEILEQFDEEEFIEDEDDYEDERSIDELIRQYGDKPKTRFGCVVWIIAIIAIAALVLAVGGLFTHASVSITPKTFSGTVDDSIALSQTRSETDIQVGVVTKDFQSEVVIPATGQSAADAKAAGTVRFYNATSSAKKIPAGTELVSSKQISYTTIKTITIPKQKSASIPGQVDGSISAVNAGDSGNDSLDDFAFAKPAPAEKGITIHGVTAISGGASGNESAADPSVLDQAKKTVAANLSDQESLVARLSQELPDNAIALPLVIPLADPTVTVDGTHAGEVHVIAHRTVSTFIVDKSAIAQALVAGLSVPDGTHVTMNSFDGLTVTSSDVAQSGAIPQVIHIRITGTATLLGDVDLAQIKSQILGLSRSKTRTLLNSIPEISSYTLSVTPPWRRLLPTDASQISVD